MKTLVERANGRLISLPIDYEKEYKEAKVKLQYHRERVCYHMSMESYYTEQLEELEPLTNVRERAIARAKKELENSKEFTEIRKKVKRKAADLLVERMLKEIARANV